MALCASAAILVRSRQRPALSGVQIGSFCASVRGTDQGNFVYSTIHWSVPRTGGWVVTLFGW